MTPPSGTADLLQRFREGDRQAFAEIVDRYERPLVSFFYRLCWDRHEAEDLAQDVFLRVLRSSRNYVAQGKLSTFLFRIATNLWIDRYRSQKPRPRIYSLDQPGLPEEGPGDGSGGRPTDRGPWLASAEPGPVENAAGEEEKALLRRSLERLTEPHRIVFELAVYHEMPYQEISETLGIPVGTVKSRMHNAVRFLRKILDPRAEGAGEEKGRPKAVGEAARG